MTLTNKSPDSPPDISLTPQEGWHCTHIFYRIDRAALASFTSTEIQTGRHQIIETLNPAAPNVTQRLQTSIVSGHKADFGLMMMDPDPLKIDAVHQGLLAGPLGPALSASYSFLSLSEISEYVPTLEQYAQRLLHEGEQEDSPSLKAKLDAYAKREPMMRRKRLTPDFPPWPATCFYPMNKKREAGQNWFMLSLDDRTALMAEHAKTGMRFGGKVSQLITVGVGLDDWEWGVTLWARNPEFLKDIVYRMRFDEASARYAEFGEFYTSYITTAEKILDHCRVGSAIA